MIERLKTLGFSPTRTRIVRSTGVTTAIGVKGASPAVLHSVMDACGVHGELRVMDGGLGWFVILKGDVS